MKRGIMVCISVLLAIGIVGLPQFGRCAEKKVVMKLATANRGDIKNTWSQGLLMLEKKIEQYTGGEIDAQVFRGTLGASDS